MEKTKNPQELKKLGAAVQWLADGIKKRVDYYAGTEQGRREAGEAAEAVGHFAYETARFGAAVGGAVIRSLYRKACDCFKAGSQVIDGDYKGAGKTIIDMEMRKVRGAGQLIKTAGGATVDGAVIAYQKGKDKEPDPNRKNRFKHRLKQCALAGGVVLAGAELVDFVDGDNIFAEGLFPEVDVDDLPGVQNGMLVDASPENLAVLAEQGELPDTEHLTEVVRDAGAREAFLAEHGFSEVPDGWEVHHIVPLSEGGADEPSNMILLREHDHDWITTQHRIFYGWPGPEYWHHSSAL